MAAMTSGGSSETEWDEAEFLTLMSNPHWSTDYLCAMLSNRSSTSIALVRQGVCDFHKDRPNLFLSKMMVDYLKTKQGLRSCYVCEEIF